MDWNALFTVWSTRYVLRDPEAVSMPAIYTENVYNLVYLIWT